VSSTDPDYIVRLYEPGEEEAIVELLKISYPEWKNAESPLDYWKWKYLENPHGSIVVVADQDGEIVGIMHRLLLKNKVDEIILSAIGDDVAVHPDYRRKGIYKNMKLYDEKLFKEKKVALKFSIEIHKATVIIAEREGYALFPFPISHMLQVIDIGLHFKMRPTKHNLVAKYGFSMLKLLNHKEKTIKHSHTNPEIKTKT
jgi:GNAT superfamily N-acetyltransferase